MSMSSALILLSIVAGGLPPAELATLKEQARAVVAAATQPITMTPPEPTQPEPVARVLDPRLNPFVDAMVATLRADFLRRPGGS